MSQRRADRGRPGTKTLELRNEPQPIKRKTRREQQSHTKSQGKGGTLGERALGWKDGVLPGLVEPGSQVVRLRGRAQAQHL